MNHRKPHIVLNGRWKITNRYSGWCWWAWYDAAKWCDHMNMKGKK